MLRHAETPKGPRRVPTVACDGSKNGHLTAPRVGFYLSATLALRVPSPLSSRKFLASYLRRALGRRTARRPTHLRKAREARRHRSRPRVGPRHLLHHRRHYGLEAHAVRHRLARPGHGTGL